MDPLEGHRDVLANPGCSAPTDFLRALAACPPGVWDDVKRRVVNEWREPDAVVPTLTVRTPLARAFLAKVRRCRDLGQLADLLQNSVTSTVSANEEEEEEVTRVVLWCERVLEAAIQSSTNWWPEHRDKMMAALRETEGTEAKSKAKIFADIAQLVRDGLDPAELHKIVDTATRAAQGNATR